MSETKIPEIYLGDGVYASWDGYHIWLDTRAQDPVHRIALEPSVLAALEAYRARIRATLTVARCEETKP